MKINTWMLGAIFSCVLLTFTVPIVRACADCVPNAACHNDTGSYICTCNCGYYGDGVNCTAFDPPLLGVSNQVVLPDVKMNVSSSFDDSNGPSETQIAWCAASDSIGEFLQIDLGFDRLVRRIATRGQQTKNSSNYVKAFKLQSSTDGRTWRTFKQNNTSHLDKVFAANADGNSVVCHVFNESAGFIARYVRLYPQSWRGRMCLRLEVYGESDECKQQIDNCPANSTCIDTRESYTCACHDGFHKDGMNCTDNDECNLQTDNCPANATCVNTMGSYTCACREGFVWDGFSCTDKDECNLQIHKCPVNITCINTEGSYACACREGFHWDGSNCTSCRPGYRGKGGHCEDIDECNEGLSICHMAASCLNNNGSYSCSCREGYVGDGFNCSDVDECSVDAVASTCHSNASCINTLGSYLCRCEQGFSGNGKTCTDVDECFQQSNECDRNADCNNAPGSYRCTCWQGFAGDGKNCTAVQADDSLPEAVFEQHKSIIISSCVIVGVGLMCVAAFVIRRRRKGRTQKVSRPSSTIMEHIERIIDDDMARCRDSASFNSSQFSIPSLHPSTLSLNNIVEHSSRPSRPKQRSLLAVNSQTPRIPSTLEAML